jgi:hypothetical protein
MVTATDWKLWVITADYNSVAVILYCDGYGHLRRNGSKIHVTSLRQMWALIIHSKEFLGNGSNSVVPLQQTETELLDSEATLDNNLTNRRKVTLRQGVCYPGRQHPISGRWGIKTRRSKGTNQRRSVKRRSNESDYSSNQEASNQRINQDKESTRKWRARIVKEICSDD